MNNKEDCILCQIVDGNVPSKKVYEDKDILAVLDVNGASPGHCFVMPKKHFTILEQIPDFLVGNLFKIANDVSSAIFETLNIEGTNVFVTNGIAAGQITPHFVINVIPRKEKDNINLQWQPKQLSEEEMSTIELQLKEATKDIGVFEKIEPKKTDKKETETIFWEDNYLMKQLRRIP